VALEELLGTLRAIHGALEDLYLNGNRPELRPRRFSIEQLLRVPREEIPRSDQAELAIHDVRKCLEQLVLGTIRRPEG